MISDNEWSKRSERIQQVVGHFRRGDREIADSVRTPIPPPTPRPRLGSAIEGPRIGGDEIPDDLSREPSWEEE